MNKIILSILLLGVTCPTTFTRDTKSGENITMSATNVTSNDGVYNAKNTIKVEATKSIKHTKMTCIAPDIHLQASETMELKKSSYTAPIITLLASSLLLTKSDFEGVLSVESDNITINDCFIKALVIANYGKENVIVTITGSSVIGEIVFLGQEGTIKKDDTVVIVNQKK